jgi:hypothetical protein
LGITISHFASGPDVPAPAGFKAWFDKAWFDKAWFGVVAISIVAAAGSTGDGAGGGPATGLAANFGFAGATLI